MSYRSCWAGPGIANGAAQWPTRLQRSLGHQLRALNHFGVFNEDIGEQYGDFSRWHNPFDEAAPIELRARSYLAANCASRLKRSGEFTVLGMERRLIAFKYLSYSAVD